MKRKYNIVVFAAYFIGRIYGFALDEELNTINTRLVDCHNICSASDKEHSYSNKGPCKCVNVSGGNTRLSNKARMVPLIHNLAPKVEQQKVKKVKRQAIKELIKKRNKFDGTSNKFLNLFSTESPSMKDKINKYFKKPPLKSRTSGLLRSDKPTQRLKAIGERMQGLKERLSFKPQFQSRGSFSDINKSKNIIKQLQDRREEILKDFKYLQSKPIVSKDASIPKEKVSSISYLQNRIDASGSSLNDKLKQKVEERKTKVEAKESKTSDKTTDIRKQSITTEASKITSAIPEIVLGQIEPTSPKTEIKVQKVNLSGITESSTKKIETVSLALEKIKEKQKEAVMKIKNKLSVSKNKSKISEPDQDRNPV